MRKPGDLEFVPWQVGAVMRLAVVPAQAGTHSHNVIRIVSAGIWAPAFAGATLLAFRRSDRHPQRADTCDLGLDFVARHQCADACGRAGHDDVAGRQLNHFG
jgi:hypothetical protein